MSFVDVFNRLPDECGPQVRRFRELIAPVSDARLEAMAHEARQTSLRYFGRTIRLFAPLYLSNECVNNCSYCGFSRDNAILRVTLEIDQTVAEARHLVQEGFRNILLVAGEHPKFVSTDYLKRTVEALREVVPSVSLEVGPMETPEYEPLVAAGAEGLIVYQETYDREAYRQVHTLGPKKDFDWRLETPERAYRAGFRRLGIGALMGLADWTKEATALAAHVEYLLRACWRSQLTISLPRLRPAAGGFEPTHPLPDREFVQMICAFRICFPQVGIVLSTREPASLRDGLIPLGVTMISAGSHTEPGGYTGAGSDRVHLAGGKPTEVIVGGEATVAIRDGSLTSAEEQFRISDERTPAEMAEQLRSMGYEPVWKDWDAALSGGQGNV